MTSSSDTPRLRQAPSTSPSTSNTLASLLTRNDALGTLARFYTTTYFPDYIALSLLLLIYIPLALLVTPFHRLFLLSDPLIQYPHAAIERVPPIHLLLYGLLLPLAFITAWALLLRPDVNKVRATYLGLLGAVFVATVVTDILKNIAGRPRPDLLARCQPRPGTPRDVLVDISVCSTPLTSHVLQDGFRSWPSGHSSFAFSGLGFLSLWLLGQTHALRPAPEGNLLAVLVAGVPLMGAALVGVSRTEDYRHHWSDVASGTVLGVVCAWGSYRRFWPGVRSRRCGECHVRTERRRVVGVGKDEESVGNGLERFDVGEEDVSEDEREGLVRGAGHDAQRLGRGR